MYKKDCLMSGTVFKKYAAFEEGEFFESVGKSERLPLGPARVSLVTRSPLCFALLN